MIEQHAFGNPVICAVCGQPVGAVWAESYDAAVNGQGICQTCLDDKRASSEPPPVAAPEDAPADA